MRRVLYIEGNKDGTIGGSYYSLLYLIQGLDRAKYEPYVLFCQDNPLISEFAKCAASVRVIDFHPSVSHPCRSVVDYLRWPYDLILDVLFKQPRINRILKVIKPDLVHLNNGYSSMHEWMLACRLSRTKIICHDRGTGYPCSFRTKLFVRFLGAIICVSDSYRDNIVRQKLRVASYRVHNGLDVDRMTSNLDADALKALKALKALRRALGVQDATIVLGMVGNIIRWKGQLVLLKALRTILAEREDVVCVFVGKVPRGEEEYKRELDEYIERNRLGAKVRFTGYRSDVAGILQIVDVLIHASISPEPFGRVMLEGMAAGKPVVGTNGGGVPEIIVDRETGLMVPMGDPQAMAEAVLYLLANPEKAREMGRRGRTRLVEQFSTEQMVRQTEEIYANIFFKAESEKALSQ